MYGLLLVFGALYLFSPYIVLFFCDYTVKEKNKLGNDEDIQ